MAYTKKQVSEIIGMPLRAVQYFTERNLVIPEIDAGEGKGQTRKYSKRNLIEFGIIKALTDYGIAFAQVKKAFEMVDFAHHHGSEDPFIIIYKVPTGSGFIYEWSKTLALDEHYRGVAESILIINLRKIREKIEKS